MFKKIKVYLIKFLENLLYNFYKKDLKNILEDRKSSVRKILADIFIPPSADVVPLIVEEGRYNYYLDDNNQSTIINFWLPSHNIFVFVAGPYTSGWENARKYGYSREKYDEANRQLNAHVENILLIDNELKNKKVLVVKWDDPIEPHSIYYSIRQPLKNINETSN